jgi:hypothetical protein
MRIQNAADLAVTIEEISNEIDGLDLFLDTAHFRFVHDDGTGILITFNIEDQWTIVDD